MSGMGHGTNPSEILSGSTPPPNFWSVDQTDQPGGSRLTETQTDGTDFIPWTANEGGKY